MVMDEKDGQHIPSGWDKVCDAAMCLQQIVIRRFRMTRDLQCQGAVDR